MYIRRKVFSVLDTEIGERLFSTTDYVLDQREFAGETKRRNKALKRQYLEKLGQERMERYNNDTFLTRANKMLKGTRDSYNTKFGQKGAGDVVMGRLESEASQKLDNLAWKEHLKKNYPDMFKGERENKKWVKFNKKMLKANSNPEVVVVPEKALVVSNSKPVESKLSKLAKNKYAKGAAGLLVLGGTAAGGYYLLNKKKNKKDKEDKE